MLHVTAWESTEAVFEGAAQYLKRHHFFILYGPFKKGEKHTSKSNELFDKSLKIKNKLWGVRDLEAIHNIAKKNGLKAHEIINMPANNLLVVYQIN